MRSPHDTPLDAERLLTLEKTAMAEELPSMPQGNPPEVETASASPDERPANNASEPKVGHRFVVFALLPSWMVSMLVHAI
ncbi:MAG: hypothetical protein VX035_05230, partial [Planctomycetota bacterium]|nr:hypothetical protein [Planctomycetota bacterium]